MSDQEITTACDELRRLSNLSELLETKKSVRNAGLFWA